MTTKFWIHLELVSLHSVVAWTAWQKLCRAFQLWTSNMVNIHETINYNQASNISLLSLCLLIT